MKRFLTFPRLSMIFLGVFGVMLAGIFVLQTGDYVVCAVSGKPIPLERLTYWSVELQEAYANGTLMAQRWVETHPRG